MTSSGLCARRYTRATALRIAITTGIRLLVAIVRCFASGTAIYVLVLHHVGGLVYRGVFSLFVGVFALWALYGNDEPDRYFDTNG